VAQRIHRLAMAGWSIEMPPTNVLTKLTATIFRIRHEL
jgi:hypothetical protein